MYVLQPDSWNRVHLVKNDHGNTSLRSGKWDVYISQERPALVMLRNICYRVRLCPKTRQTSSVSSPRVRSSGRGPSPCRPGGPGTEPAPASPAPRTSSLRGEADAWGTSETLGGGTEAPLNRRLGSVLTALLLGGVRPHPPSQVGPVLTVLLRVHPHVAPLPGQEQKVREGVCSGDAMWTRGRRG